jgi:hypothetical protein
MAISGLLWNEGQGKRTVPNNQVTFTSVIIFFDGMTLSPAEKSMSS